VIHAVQSVKEFSDFMLRPPAIEIFCLRGSAAQKHAPSSTEIMTDTQVRASAGRQAAKFATRLGIVLLVAATIGGLLNHVSASLERNAHPAGFSRGLLQGALMPMSFPNLLVGRDVTIYSQYNTGLTYKLGYTTGVNGCGAVFFGLLFWRLSRWRQRKV
jgi:hypothetical protein